ncbi:O-antigen ligase [Pseudomonas cuatrocienegasensis]|uniref:O-antigen ligase n=1 Tax=Pseudomonas cuatrocienegasensis TaxID=543360 RepID=A0ABY1BH00_9PSED|nr:MULTISPECIES: O-antigen ligase family protein [Pseudomonas]OEC32919.1 lipid A core--O-antigen ligase [Pseudomonas sp. 21C1]SEQ84313.1 O-antigen ligase [Pseudomonas cuatrocienegasensis]
MLTTIRRLSPLATTNPYLGAWLAFGLAWFLLGMLFLPNSKLYHQGLILFLWLPGLAVYRPGLWQQLGWDRWLLSAVLAFAGWSLLSMLWGGDSGLIKEMLYVGLTVQALALIGSIYRERFWPLLACIVLVGGLWVGWFILSFYVLQGMPLNARLVGGGVLDHPILAAQVVGGLGILLWFLRRSLPANLQGWVWLLGCGLCLAFVVLSRSKGPMLAVVATLVLSCLWMPGRRIQIFSCLVVVGAASAILAFPEFLLRGGLSYRPDLLRDAWTLFLQHPWLGLGAGAEYQLTVVQIGQVFEHAHNLFMHVLLQLGVPGLALWGLMLAIVAMRAWRARETIAGRALCGLLCFSGLALLSDGVGPWIKPREEWFTVWLPVFLCLAQYASTYTQSCDKRTA